MNEQQLRRLSDCEVMVSKYHDKLDQLILQNTNYNKQIISKDEFQKIWDEFNNRVSRDLGMIRKELQAIQSENRHIIDTEKRLEHDVMTNHMNHHDKLMKHLDSIEKLDTQIDNLHMQHGTHEAHIRYMKDRIENCEKISPKLDELAQKTGEFALISAKVDDELRKRIEDLYNLYRERKTSEDALISWGQQLEKKINDLPSDLQNKLRSFDQDMTERFLGFSAKFQAKIDNLPKPEVIQSHESNPLELVMFKNDIMQLVNPLKLDVSNSKEKSDINEMQLKIMDKKLENIYLLLKKHELTQ